MNRFKKVNRTTVLVIFLLLIMIMISVGISQIGYLKTVLPQEVMKNITSIICYFGNPLSVSPIIFIQWFSFVLIFATSIWIFIKLNVMRKSVAFDISKKSGTIHLRTQILTVLTIVVLVFSTLVIFSVNPTDSKFALVLSICTAIIGIVFPDIIRSITAYTHLSANNHLHIGDWISIPKQGVDGMVKSVSMLSVTISNWDNSISTIPTYTLLNEHMQNFQQILDINKYGRKLCKTFLIDASSVHSMTPDEVAILRSRLESLSQDTITLDDIVYPTLNLKLFRQFLHHWLKNQKEITHSPRLLATLMEPTAEGIPLQIYVFILKSGKEAFELIQSEITEFIIMSMDWFGLRLFQSPSDYQISHIGKISSNENHQHF